MKTFIKIICSILLITIYVLVRIHYWLAGSPESKIEWTFKESMKEHWEKGPQELYK